MKRLAIGRRTLTIVAVLVPLAGLLGWVALRAGPLAPVAVTLAQVEAHALRPALFGVGSVEARQVHRIGPVAPGRVLQLLVDVGSTVRVGQVLGLMDPVDADERLRAQEAVVRRSAAVVADATARQAFAQTQAHRYEALHAEQATSDEVLISRQQDLQLAGTALAAARYDQMRAQAELQALRASRASLRLVSPVDGMVTARDAEPGTTVVGGQSVIEVVDPRTVWVSARFDQAGAGGLAAALPARIALRSRHGEAIEGQVVRAEPRADAVTEELIAKVAFARLPQPMPAIGERTEVTVDLPPLPEMPVVPNAAVQRQAGRIGVWTAQGDRPVFVPVRLGRADLDGRVQVLEGLKAGDRIVLHSERTLGARSRVHVVDHLAGVTP